MSRVNLAVDYGAEDRGGGSALAPVVEVVASGGSGLTPPSLGNSGGVMALQEPVLVAAAPPYIPPPQPVQSYVPPALIAAAAGDIANNSPVFVGDNQPINAFDIKVPGNPTQAVVVDGVPLTSIAADQNAAPPPITSLLALVTDSTTASLPPAAPATDGTPAGVGTIADPTKSAKLDPNAAVAAVTSPEAISGWWVIGIGAAVWYFFLRKGK